MLSFVLGVLSMLRCRGLLLFVGRLSGGELEGLLRGVYWMRGNGLDLLPKVRNLVLESIFRLAGEVGTRSSWSSIPNRFNTGRSPTRNRSTLGSKSLPVVIPDRTTFVGAFPKAARRRRGSRNTR